MEYREVDVDKLIPNPYQPRGEPSAELDELKMSLESRGNIQPVIVREYKGKYQIIAGERRWRAAKLARMKKIPVLVRDTAEEDVLLESLIENLHRRDLESHEREGAVYELWKSSRWKTEEELGRALGKSASWVSNNITAARIREKEKWESQISTRLLVDTAPLEKEEREKIITKVEKEEIAVSKVPEYVKIVKKAPPIIKKAVLKPKARITPKIAEKIIEKIPTEKYPEVLQRIETEKLEEEEALERIPIWEEEFKPLPPAVVERWEELKKRYEEFKEEIKAELETPEAKERGKLFRNWVAHTAISGSLKSIFCPECGADWRQFGWICHKLNAREALEKVEEEYQISIEKGKKK